jgi:restriction system protein
MVAERAGRVIIVASGTYTQEAQSFARGKPIDLIDGKALVQLIRDVKGESVVAPVATSFQPLQAAPQKVLNVQTAGSADVAPSCPKCGAPMVLRTARKGAHAGGQFWGCPKYPACNGIVNV